MALKSDLQCKYDGVCLYITISARPTIITKFILSFFNVFLAIAIVFFLKEQVIVAALAFTALEVFVIKYTLWNLYGYERVTINTKSLSIQLHYGIFTTPPKITVLNKRIFMCPADAIVQNEQKFVKIHIYSYNEFHLQSLIYQSVLFIPDTEYQRVVSQFHQLFLDEMVEEKGMPLIYLN